MTAETKENHEQPGARGHAVPRRFWWLKRLTLGVIVCALALLGLRLWWGWYAERRLQAALVELRAAGEPVFPEDFGQAGAQYEGSAAQCLATAADKLGGIMQLGRQRRNQRPKGELPARIDLNYTDDELAPLLNQPALVAEFLATYSGPLAKAKVAAQKPYVIWAAPGAKGGGRYPPHFALGLLARSCCLAAVAAHLAGDGCLCASYLDEALVNSRHAQALEPSALTCLERSIWEHHVAWALERVLPDLNVPCAGRAAPDESPETRARLEAIKERLLDESDHEEGRRLAALSQRAAELDWCRDVITPSPSGAARLRASYGSWVQAARFWLEPAWKLDALRALEFVNQRVRAETAPNWPAARALIPEKSAAYLESPPVQLARMPSISIWPIRLELLKEAFREMARRRMAGTAIAIRLFEIDHGRRPVNLSELVPDYLAALPQDPFACDADLSYRPGGAAPLLYCVGPDGQNEGGAPQEASKLANYARDGLVFRLGER